MSSASAPTASRWNISAAIAISYQSRTWTASSATTPRGCTAFRPRERSHQPAHHAQMRAVQMSESFIDPKFGRVSFGARPASYHATRPGYPDWVFDILRERCRLTHGTATFEIGAGTGTATRRLLDLGANPLLAIEPDPRLANFLRETIQDPALSLSVS